MRTISWSWFWIGVVIVPSRASMVWTLSFRLLLRFARLDMMALGAGLMVDRVVFESRVEF